MTATVIDLMTREPIDPAEIDPSPMRMSTALERVRALLLEAVDTMRDGDEVAAGRALEEADDLVTGALNAIVASDRRAASARRRKRQTRMRHA